MRRMLVSSDEAVKSSVQHTAPCSDCPWRRDSLSGWLGDNTADEWVQIAHADVRVPCHVISNQQCAGIAIYRSNVCKLSRPPILKLPKDTEKVFAWPNEFKEHHAKIGTLPQTDNQGDEK